MDKPPHEKPVACFIGARILQPSDPYLRRLEVYSGLVIFGIPHYGVQFKCRADGELVDLEFAAFFALLRTITTKLKDEGLRAIEVCSSNPEFVFAFTGKSRHLLDGSERAKLLKEYSSRLAITVRFVHPHENRALASPADFPTLPTNRYVSMTPDPFDYKNVSIKPLQRGVSL